MSNWNLRKQNQRTVVTAVHESERGLEDVTPCGPLCSVGHAIVVNLVLCLTKLNFLRDAVYKNKSSYKQDFVLSTILIIHRTLGMCPSWIKEGSYLCYGFICWSYLPHLSRAHRVSIILNSQASLGWAQCHSGCLNGHLCWETWSSPPAHFWVEFQTPFLMFSLVCSLRASLCTGVHLCWWKKPLTFLEIARGKDCILVAVAYDSVNVPCWMNEGQI